MTTLNNNMNNNNNEMNNKGENNMSISFNETIGMDQFRGVAVNRELRRRFYAAINKIRPVVMKHEIPVDDKGNLAEEELQPYYKIANNAPIIEAFGYSDVKLYNQVVDVADDDNSVMRKRRINIDGEKFVLSENVIIVECKHEGYMAFITRYGYNYNGEHYEVCSSSPSQEKHSTKYFAKITDEIINQRSIMDVVEVVAGGVFRANWQKELPGAKVLKMLTRLGNYNSDMLKLAEIDLQEERIAIVDGSINGAYDYDDETREAMKQLGVDIDNHINDGAVYLAPSKIVEIAANLGMEITEEQARQIAIQVRINGVTVKCMSITMLEDKMIEIAENNNAEFYGKEDGHLVMLVDTDGAKLINKQGLKDRMTLDVYVMAIANASNPKSSTQHLIKYMMVDPERTVAIMNSIAEDKMDNYYYNMTEENNVATTVYAQIMAALGDAAIEYKLFNEAMIYDLQKYGEAMIRKNRVDIEGIYTHMSFDHSYMLTAGNVERILGVNEDGLVEVYNPDVCSKYAKEIKAIEAKEKELEMNREFLSEETIARVEEEIKVAYRNLLSGVAVKFPSAMPNEYECVQYQTYKQMMRKIDACNGTNVDKKVLRDYVKHAPFGVTLLAPINGLKNKLAGADVDFDAFMVDMSELKHILIDKRIKDAKNLGYCTFISYKDITTRPDLEELEAELKDLDI